MGSQTMCHLVQRFAPRPLQCTCSANARTRILARLLSMLLLAGCVWAAPRPKPSASVRPNIVLITLDTTRADRMGFLGSERGLTPNLDALASQSTVFLRAYAQVPLTTPSHATILTGTYPQFSNVNYMGDPVGKTLPYLPDILHKNGYRTAAFVGALVLDPKKLAPGFERGFDVYDAGFHRRRPGEDHYQSLERRGEEVVTRALTWLSKKPAGPFFLWVHLYDPHDPYSPPEPYKSRYQAEPYDGEIAYTDSVVDKLLTALRKRGQIDSTVIAVVADHGEAFGEHGEAHHGIFLYDETIHVPFLLKVPGQHSSMKVSTRVGLVDLAPTVLQAAGLIIPPAMQGTSLAELMKSKTKGSIRIRYVPFMPRAAMGIFPLAGANCKRGELASICMLKRRNASCMTNPRTHRRHTTWRPSPRPSWIPHPRRSPNFIERLRGIPERRVR